jgi:hypothetical protein
MISRYLVALEEENKMKTTQTTASDIISITYRYVASYAIYLGVRLDIFTDQREIFTASVLQEHLVKKYEKDFNEESLRCLLETLSANKLLIKSGDDSFKLTELAMPFCKQSVQQGILQEFSDARWARISRMSAEDLRFSVQAMDELLIAEKYTAYLPPELTQLIKGYQDVKILQCACELGLFEKMNQQPESLSVLALRCQIDIGRLSAILDFLGRLGVIDVIGNDYYQLNSCSRLLSRDGGNFAAFVLHENKQKWLSLQKLYETMQTGECAFTKANGMPIFELLKSDPAASRIFNEAMTAVSETIEIPAIVELPVFEGVVMDVGGGEGKLLSAVLDEHEGVEGIVFDLPQVINCTALSHSRCRLVSGSFFNREDIPTADTVILKRVLHDWGDEQAISILRHCQASLRKGGRLLIIEYLADSELMAKAGLMMMAIGGKPRTAQDFQRLAEKAGLFYQQTTSLTPMLSVIELQGVALRDEIDIDSNKIIGLAKYN